MVMAYSSHGKLMQTELVQGMWPSVSWPRDPARPPTQRKLRGQTLQPHSLPALSVPRGLPLEAPNWKPEGATAVSTQVSSGAEDRDENVEDRSEGKQETPAQQGDLGKLYVCPRVVQESGVVCESQGGVGRQPGDEVHPTPRTEPQENRLGYRGQKPFQSFLEGASFESLSCHCQIQSAGVISPVPPALLLSYSRVQPWPPSLMPHHSRTRETPRAPGIG